MNNIICINDCRRYKRPSYLLQYILFQGKGSKCQKSRIQMEIYLESRKIQILQPVKRSRMRMLVLLVRVSNLKQVRQSHCLRTQMYETLLSLSLWCLSIFETTYLVIDRCLCSIQIGNLLLPQHHRSQTEALQLCSLLL